MNISQAEYEKLYKLAYYDNLTGCYNRNWYFEHFNSFDEFMFIIIDINGLKKINDIQGHIVGDNFIKSIAEHLSKFGDVIRFGGDEFILIVSKDFNPKILDDDRYCYGYRIKTKNKSLEKVLEEADKWLYKYKDKKNNKK